MSRLLTWRRRRAKPAGPDAARRPRRLSDRSPLILLGIMLLIGALAAIAYLAQQSTELAPDFLTEVVLYALAAGDLTMLAVLVALLARNLVKLIVEHRRALPFARFRAKLVGAMLGLAVIPAVLVLITGSELIRNSVSHWFHSSLDDVLTAAQSIASDYYQDRERLVTAHAARIAEELDGVDLSNTAAIRSLILPEITAGRLSVVEIFKATVGRSAGQTRMRLVVSVVDPAFASRYDKPSAEWLALAAGRGEALRRIERWASSSELMRAAVPIRSGPAVAEERGESPQRRIVGAVVASSLLEGQLAEQAHKITAAYEDYKQLIVLRRPLTGVYLSFFLMVTLLILVAATWMGLYTAKRITRPIQLVSDAARAIGAGHLEQHVDHQASDEFSGLVDAFNTMAAELAVSRRKLERSRTDLERKNLEVEERRRYIETILERITTGVISVDPTGRVTTVNSAAARLLGLNVGAVGQPMDELLERDGLQPLAALLVEALSVRTRSESDPQVREVALTRDGRPMHLAAAATALHGNGATGGGAVLVFDDLTPLIRAQKVAAWREVARRLAHEIKNPLTPIQLCAERLGRRFADAEPTQRALVGECTSTIIGEVESLKALVDEFSQFARMPPPRAVATDVCGLVNDALTLYDGLFRDVTFVRHFDALPPVRLDPEQIRRVVINLIDNALEAMERRGTISVETNQDASNAVVRIVIADDGPGIPASDRERLFMPYYSTKRQGSGLGLAIVRRIVAEHHGSIQAEHNSPRGTRMVVELPFEPVAA